MSSSPDLPVGPIGYMLKRAQHALRTRMDEALRALDLTAPAYAVLAAVEQEPGISNAALARAAFVTPQTMQGMVASLERAGLLARTPDPDHGRILRAELTQKGRAVLAQAHEVAAQMETLLTEGLGTTQREDLLAHLARCAANMSERG